MKHPALPIPLILVGAISLLSAVLSGCHSDVPAGASSNTLTVGATGAATTHSTVQAVQNKIGADPALRGATIKVSAAEGSISLDGTVKTPQQKDRAETIVRQVQKQRGEQVGVMDNLIVGS